MVLYLIGTGLNDERDMTLGGIELMKTADKVYLESYTSILSQRADLTKFTNGKPLIEADRRMIEENCDQIIDEARDKSIVLLVVGDPFCATTHSDLVLRAHEKNVKVEVLHNASIISAIGCTGLQLYRFGEVVSIPFFDENWQPSSFYEKIKANIDRGLHTLCLLDIKVKEQTIENIMRNRPIFEPPRFMTVNQAISQLFILEDKLKQNVISRKSIAIGVARIGSKEQKIVSGTLSELSSVDFGNPLHSLVICHPDLHLIEQCFFEIYREK